MFFEQMMPAVDDSFEVLEKFHSNRLKKMAVDGRIVLGVLATPFIYSGLKSAYWSVQLKKLNDREVMSERYVGHS